MIRTTGKLTNSSIIATLAMMVVVCPLQAVELCCVQLKSFATSEDHLIQLREIAYLKGDIAQKLGNTIVAQLPKRQTQIRISLQKVSEHLSALGVNWGRLNLTGAANCQVRIVDATSSVTPTPTAIVSNPNKSIAANDAITVQQKVEQFLLQYTGYSDQQLVVKFSPADQRQLQQSALMDRFEIEVASSAKLGQLPLTIRRWRGTTLVRQIRVTAKVSYKTLALVMVNNVRRGDQFGRNDVQLQEVQIHNDDAKPIAKLRKVVGLVASRNVHKKQILFAGDLKQPWVIQRGQMVSVRAIVGGMVIRTTARAMADATMDQMVQLKNERSRQTFTARAIGPLEAVVGSDGAIGQLSMAGRTQ